MTKPDPNGGGTAALLREAKLVPVLVIRSVDRAVPLAKALAAGGVKTLEITLRTEAGAAAAKAIKAEVEGVVVGLGTVTRANEIDLCLEMGLSFAFSPGASPALLDAAESAGLAFVPGIQTASEIMACLERGFDVMKFFPAVPAGGIATLRALAGPFPHVTFCPTGGISEDEAPTWLKEKNVLAVGGSWLAPADLVEAADWAAITARARRSMGLVAG